MAKHISSWSKDTSTQCGAVITDGIDIVSLGFNGLPKYVEDSKERYDNRDLKYSLIVHAEVNSIIHAKRNLDACTLYLWPFSPCSNCSSIVIQSGITRVVAPKMPADKAGRWLSSMDLAATMFLEAGVELCLLDV